MVALSDHKIAIVKTLVESAPDQIVGSLQRALAESAGDTVLAGVRQLVEAEASDRMLRSAVFQPVAPLFVGDGSPHGLVFPARALTSIWRGLKAETPQEMADALKACTAVADALASEQRPPDTSRIYNVLVLAAARALRAAERREFRAAAEVCDRIRPGGAESLAACLDIAPIVRRCLPRLEAWAAHPDEACGAAARLAYKDAAAVADDAGLRFFEILAAHLTPPWMVLRIISAVMDKPGERYLADSELGGFPERVLLVIDDSLKAISKLGLDDGPEAGHAAGQLVDLINQQTFELEVCMELSRDPGSWGRRILAQKKALANLVEARLREAEKLLAAALPMESSGFSRTRRRHPKLDEPPNAKDAVRAMTLLTFTHEIRRCANYAGFSAPYARTAEKLGGVLDHYVDDVLDDLRGGDAPDVDIARAYLGIAADAVGLVRDEKAAEIVRRRAATACAGPGHSVILDA